MIVQRDDTKPVSTFLTKHKATTNSATSKYNTVNLKFEQSLHVDIRLDSETPYSKYGLNAHKLLNLNYVN